MACITCYEDYIVKCNDSIRVYALLSPLTDYKWIIEDKFGKEYSGEITTDAEGFFDIPVAELPSGLLTEYSGSFNLYIETSVCERVSFLMAKKVNCINFTIKGGTYEKATLGCDFSCSPAAGSQTTLVSFTNDDEITITWTSELLAAHGNSPVVQVYHLISGTTYQLVDVEIQHVFADGVLTSITVDNAGPATGYILIS